MHSRLKSMLPISRSQSLMSQERYYFSEIFAKLPLLQPITLNERIGNNTVNDAIAARNFSVSRYYDTYYMSVSLDSIQKTNLKAKAAGSLTVIDRTADQLNDAAWDFMMKLCLIRIKPLT